MNLGRLDAGAARRVGMLAVAALLLLAMLNPALPWRDPPGALTLLIDDSASLVPGSAERAWSSLRPLLHRLPDGSTLTLIRFGAEPAMELARHPLQGDLPQVLPRAQALSRSGTNLTAALALIPGGSTALLVSDGLATSAGVEAALRDAEARGVAISWWRRPAVSAPAWIAALDVPTRISARRDLPLSLTLGAAEDTSAMLAIALDGAPRLQHRLDLEQGRPRVLDLELPAPAAGVHLVKASLEPLPPPASEHRQAPSPAASASALVQVGGTESVLLIGRETRDLDAALSAGGWDVRPHRLDQADDPSLQAELTRDLEDAAVTLLNNVPVSALGPRLWQQLAAEVTMRGAGLLVLGGDRSFAAGGYRHSQLESLLPLLSEPPRRLPAARVLFALDTSGSMAQPASPGLSRLALARLSAADAAAVLGEQDQVGVALFGTEAALALAPAARADVRQSIMALTAEQPGGGTRLAPLVALAREQIGLSDDRAPPGDGKRLLVVLSDGQFADTAEAEPAVLGRRLAAAGIEVLAIGIGHAQRTEPLRQLAASAGGTFHQVAPGAALPGFVAEQLQANRSKTRLGPFAAVDADPLPFGTPTPLASWPAVSGYQPLRLRDGAHAPVTSNDGDPLLAWQQAGLGRVAVLTAGLGESAPDWRRWDRLPSLLGPMLAWLAGNDADRHLSVQAEHFPSRIRLKVDAVDADGAWASIPSLDWRLHPPDQPAGSGATSGSITAVAPGRFDLYLPASAPGRYDVVLSAAGRELRQVLWHEPRREWLPSKAADAALAALARLPNGSPEAGWPPPGWPQGWSGHGPRPGTAPYLVVAALLIFLGLVLMERLGPGFGLESLMARKPGRPFRPWHGRRNP